MSEKDFLMITQVVLSILFTISVLIQDRGTGLSATFGGGGEFHSSRRGAEKVLYYASVVFGVLFFCNAILFFYI